jgi:hypothetical protein
MIEVKVYRPWQQCSKLQLFTLMLSGKMRHILLVSLGKLIASFRADARISQHSKIPPPPPPRVTPAKKVADKC